MSRQAWYKKSGLVGWEDAKKRVDAAYDEEFPARPVQEWIDETLKKKALDELFGVK
jgi:hypothetical protein